MSALRAHQDIHLPKLFSFGHTKPYYLLSKGKGRADFRNPGPGGGHAKGGQHLDQPPVQMAPTL
jgi:hypothetical protein